MANLQEQLVKLLPTILPSDPDEAMTGIQLLEVVRPRIKGVFADQSIRQAFSILSSDDSSPIAKRDGRQGYFLRPAFNNQHKATTQESASPKATGSGSRDDQREEKFRALYCKFRELTPEIFAKPIEHTAAKKQPAGINKWKFPDVVLLEWDSGVIDSENGALSKDMLALRQSLGEQPYRLRSVELKVEITASDLRQSFFQCLSNSSWSHAATLAVAMQVTEESVADELRRLGSSYHVEVISFGLTEEQMSALPSAATIREMNERNVEELVSHIEVQTIAPSTPRGTLNWQHFADLRSQSSDFVDLSRWIVKCVSEAKAKSFDDFKRWDGND